MLENIIKNPIETPRGTRNPGNGIALRGPLSQFFSGLFLKKLDDAFDQADVTYLRLLLWWVKTSLQIWTYDKLLNLLIESCWGALHKTIYASRARLDSLSRSSRNRHGITRPRYIIEQKGWEFGC
jgi:hypothetical protein